MKKIIFFVENRLSLAVRGPFTASSWLHPAVIVPCLLLPIVLSLPVLKQPTVIACFGAVTSRGSIQFFA